MPSDSDLEEDVRVRLRELFTVLETTRQGAVTSGGEPTEQGTVLRVLGAHLYPVLDQRVTDPAGSAVLTWHLARMAHDVVDSVPMTGRAFQPVRDATRQLRNALEEAQALGYLEAPGDGEDLKDLIRGVPPDVQGRLEPILQAQHGETLGQLEDLKSAVAQVPAGVLAALRPNFDGVGQAVAQVPADVMTALQPNFDGLAQAVAQVPADVLATFQPALNNVDDLLTELPQRLSDALIKSLPAAVAAVMAALRQPGQQTGPVIVPVTFSDLAALAAAQASAYTVSGGERIVFLQAALTALQSAIQNRQAPTLLQMSQITTVIRAVIDYVDPALTPTDLYAITSYKQQFTTILADPGLAGSS
jgi:hypothetical protein